MGSRAKVGEKIATERRKTGRQYEINLDTDMLTVQSLPIVVQDHQASSLRIYQGLRRNQVCKARIRLPVLQFGHVGHHILPAIKPNSPLTKVSQPI
jgi:hypothetical protein